MKQAPEKQIIDALLSTIRSQFYQNFPQRIYHRDHYNLIYAITWPAQWLDNRGLTMSPQRYQHFIQQRIDAIRTHARPQKRPIYFPAYLLKTIQSWFTHNGHTLYDELKHVRNALCDIETSIQRLAVEPDNSTDVLARTHHLLHRKKLPSNKPTDTQIQLKLF